MRIFGFAGWSGSGKTTLIERLIPHLIARGLTVSLVKHAHHSFDIDQPGKDSHRHRLAGCSEVLISSGLRWALVHELRGEVEMPCRSARPVVAVRPGARRGLQGLPHPQARGLAGSGGKPLLHPQDPHIAAIATDRRSLCRWPDSGLLAGGPGRNRNIYPHPRHRSAECD
jgi:molybdopterin-guanine dinucleotide biosynthesis protein B